MENIPQNQGSEDWLSYRRNKIGGSDCAIILGISPWCTPWQLYMQKLGLIEPQPMNQAMRIGSDNEQTARTLFNKTHNLELKPRVMQSKEYPWMIASLDGIDEDETIAVEIKCPGLDTHQMAVNGEIPKYYYAQMQHQMCVAGLQSMNYFSFYQGYGATVYVERSEPYINNLLEKELKFWYGMQNLEPPELTEKDYVEIHSSDWEWACTYYKMANQAYTKAEDELSYWKNELIKLADNKNSIGSGVKLQKVVRKGNVDYKLIPELKEVDLEKFRRDTSVSWRIYEV